jgi:hypothetical protein
MDEADGFRACGVISIAGFGWGEKGAAKQE